MKDTVKNMKNIKFKEWEQVFAVYTSDKGSMPATCKNSSVVRLLGLKMAKMKIRRFTESNRNDA